MDFLSSAALDMHIDNTIRKIVTEDLKGRPGSFKYIHLESFEVGVFNWTEQFINAFRSYRGYDPTPYLPALCDVLVESPEVTERFLYDYRKTRSDLFRDRHYAHLLKRTHEYGLQVTGQNGGPANNIGPMDCLELLGLCDVPQAEFWYWPEDRERTKESKMWKSKCYDSYDLSPKQTSSAAHIYGKRYVAAEAITSFLFPFLTGPRQWKIEVDRAFSQGVNRLELSTMISGCRLCSVHI